MVLVCFVLSLAFALVAVAAPSEELASLVPDSVAAARVNVGKTTILGTYNNTAGVDAFLGVKYATAERFKRAVPVDYSKNRTVVNATVHGVACAQIDVSLIPCLEKETQEN